jgi:hypothetical protein
MQDYILINNYKKYNLDTLSQDDKKCMIILINIFVLFCIFLY